MTSDPIGWERLRAIFCNPPPVREVWERQFDYFDEELQQLGRTPHDQVEFGDLWYYYHDLAYVELQPDLFAHLFPVCLMDWHRSLIANQTCAHGDSEFHKAVRRGDVFDKMLTIVQRKQVESVCRDSMLYRLDQERGFAFDGMHTPAFGWLMRMNSLGLISHELHLLWQAWWEMSTPGRAVAFLEYCSALLYVYDESPLIDVRTGSAWHVGPCWENDSLLLDGGWLQENVEFIRTYVTAARITDVVHQAVRVLQNEPESHVAAQIAVDLELRTELLERRLSELPTLLTVADGRLDWSE
ncbi:MAG: hypothetical protein KDA92_12390 [Planctomycetales bacterium]|nr:hypothetical protein [Planctomycetales bacterium]